MEHSESSSKREIHNIAAPIKDQEKFQINNLILYIKELEKGQQAKPKVSRRKEIIKIRAEINKLESKKKNTKDQ